MGHLHCEYLLCLRLGNRRVPELLRVLRSFDPDVAASCAEQLTGGAGKQRNGRVHESLALDFAREFLPDDYDEVHHIFSGRGAYRRYKDLLVRRGALERWYDFSNKAEEAALREWCVENGIDLSGT